jgi:hypothetical protein
MLTITHCYLDIFGRKVRAEFKGISGYIDMPLMDGLPGYRVDPGDGYIATGELADMLVAQTIPWGMFDITDAINESLRA